MILLKHPLSRLVLGLILTNIYCPTNAFQLPQPQKSSNQKARTQLKMSIPATQTLATTASTVRIVTYNVLSSHLARPSHFTKSDPDHLCAARRLPKVLKILEDELHGSPKPVFCLQEVSQDWAGKLHAFFAANNYHFVTGLYGKRFNGYMGVGLAFSLDQYEALDIDVSRLSDQRLGGWPKPPEVANRGLIGSAYDLLVKDIIGSFVLKPTKKLITMGNKMVGKPPRRDAIDPWEMSQNRFNIMLFARLRERSPPNAPNPSPKTFCLSTYHMPCAFFAPMVMNIHAEMVAQRTQKLSGGDPHVLAGDFNIVPGSSTYNLITNGELSKSDPTYPCSRYGVDWVSGIQPMRSAYMVMDGKEPDFTNYAQTREDDPFIDTLDYFFLSNEWKVKEVTKIPHRDNANGPYPNEDEPSDHVLIATNLEI